MSANEASFVAGVVIGCALSWLVASVVGSDHGAGKYAWMLGRLARARKYEAYPWQTGYIVSVSWKGSVRFRNLDGTEGFWLDKARAERNLRIMGGRR